MADEVDVTQERIEREIEVVSDFFAVQSLPRRELHPAIIHCHGCGCDWIDNGLNPVGCPYCKLRRETDREVKE